MAEFQFFRLYPVAAALTRQLQQLIHPSIVKKEEEVVLSDTSQGQHSRSNRTLCPSCYAARHPTRPIHPPILREPAPDVITFVSPVVTGEYDGDEDTLDRFRRKRREHRARQARRGRTQVEGVGVAEQAVLNGGWLAAKRKRRVYEEDDSDYEEEDTRNFDQVLRGLRGIHDGEHDVERERGGGIRWVERFFAGEPDYDEDDEDGDEENEEEAEGGFKDVAEFESLPAGLSQGSAGCEVGFDGLEAGSQPGGRAGIGLASVSAAATGRRNSV
ncbi:hypothetical protein P167DRAFT_566549 [Morchella conica CCBAS932]|uniref:Uncharacterized protein n=1 Tax=Morchella conica CCBAS932 TaxID=1392247 RepID=A0A3N4KIH7_9PEZI|nr:hypothetical protein P167DRAFT_566549 [Morchella conica CCBAS932]